MKFTVKEIDITPAKASEWLKKNPGNRNIKKTKVRAYVRAMKAGRWRLTHQAICIDKAGNILDGQNRLTAVVESGCTVRMLVAYGGDRNDMMVIDTGSVRQAGDVLTITKGVANGNTRVAAIRAILCAENGASYVADQIQIFEEHERWRSGFDWFFSIKTCRAVLYAPFMAALIYAHEAKPKEMDAFLRLLIEPVEVPKGSPIIAAGKFLRSAVMLNGGETRRKHFRMMLNAAASYCQKRQMLKVQDGERGIEYFKKAGARAGVRES